MASLALRTGRHGSSCLEFNYGYHACHAKVAAERTGEIVPSNSSAQFSGFLVDGSHSRQLELTLLLVIVPLNYTSITMLHIQRPYAPQSEAGVSGSR
jgi:hypothetical protein